MASSGWYNTAFKALSPQQEKIFDMFNTGLGWEVWVQAELGHEGRKGSAADNASGAVQLSSFDREQSVYQGTSQRCDFLASYIMPSLGPNKHYHFVELKCLRAGKLTDFIRDVGKDIDKVRNATPKQEWTVNTDYVAGWVMAITVNPNFDPKVGDSMEALARDKGIQWAGHRGEPLSDVDTHLRTGNSRITLWTWTKTFYRRPGI